MKKILQIITTTVVGIGMSTAMAAADSVTCGISSTGANSNNTVNCVDTNEVSVVCDNNIVVENSNNQNATSGGAFTTGNTTAGGSNSGNASNNNTVTVALGASCAPVQTTAATTPVSNSSVSPAGGKGGLAPAPAPTAAAANKAAVVALPETGSNTALDASLVGATVLGGSLLASRIGLSAFRRSMLK